MRDEDEDVLGEEEFGMDEDLDVPPEGIGEEDTEIEDPEDKYH